EWPGVFVLRDHSWGPRTWQAIWWYRWLTGNVGPDLGFALTVSRGRDGGVHSRGLRAAVRTAHHTYQLEGTVWSNIPLRNRRAAPSGEVLTTPIAEGMTTWWC